MSTKEERAFRSRRRILPVKVKVRQRDGSVQEQVVDADPKTYNPKSSKPRSAKRDPS